jgi:hypothetical protein
LDGERDGGDGAVSPGERRGHGLASVFGSKMATRAYSEAATRAATTPRTPTLGVGERGRGRASEQGRGGTQICVVRGDQETATLRPKADTGDGEGLVETRAGYGGRWLARAAYGEEDVWGGGGTVMLWTPSLYP